MDVPEGWKLVPVDPPDSMVWAGLGEEPTNGHNRAVFRIHITRMWAAMLAAAPTPPPVKVHESTPAPSRILYATSVVDFGYCQGCGKPVGAPINRYSEAVMVMGNKAWHQSCVPPGGVSGSVSVNAAGNGE